MILPNKYLLMKDCMFYQACNVFKILRKKYLDLDTLWVEYSKITKNEFSFVYYIYLIEFMYIAGMINYLPSGEIYNENIRVSNNK